MTEAAQRRSFLKRAALLAALGASAPPAALAEERRGHARGGGPPVVMSDELAFSLIASLLTLSEVQQGQLRAILEDASAEAKPVAAGLDATRDSLFDAVRAGRSDAELVALADARGRLSSRMFALQARTFARLWALLSSDQKQAVETPIFGYIGELLSSANQAAQAPPSV